MLESFFIYGNLPPSVEKGQYHFFLIILSYVVACFASYTALSLTQMMMAEQRPFHKRLIHWGGALALGSGIWSMHFIGMLAYKMRMKMEYDPLLTLISLLVAIAVAYGVLSIIDRKRLTILQIMSGSILLGFGISAMHYIGMAAMKMDADLRYIPSIFLLSVLIAIGASAAALWIAFTLARHNSKYSLLFRVGAALIMGLAICGMHYTGVEASVFIPYAQCRYDPDQDFSTLALMVAAVSSILLAGTLTLAISSQGENLRSTDKLSAFPAKMLAVAMFLTLVVVMWMGGNSFYIHYFLTHNMAKDQHLAELADEILYLDSTLSQSVKRQSTGDAAFDRRYHEALEVDLDKKIDELPDVGLQEVAHRMDRAADQLFELDNQYKNLVQQKKIVEAESIIQSKEYAKFTQFHLDGRRTLSEKIRQASHENLQNLEHNIYATLALVVVVILIICVAWYFAFGSIRRWRVELETTRSNLTQRIHEKERMERQLNDYVQRLEMAQLDSVAARESAEKANAAKSDFLANMSHEIRTPMNGVLGMAGLLLDTELDSDQRGWAEIIRKSGENLLEIINDILDFSKIEAGKLNLEPLSFDLAATVMEITDLLSLRTQEKTIELLVRFAPDLPVNVVGDPVRVRQILMNLAGNAIKFTEKGHVLIRVDWKQEAAGKVRLLFEIEDTGIGIPADKVGHIFEKFSQAEESTTRKFGGTGLGLSICTRLVKMMGGTIGVKSEFGKGSIFHFDIVLATSERKHIPESRIPDCDLSVLRVLVVDDMKLNQEILYQYLHAWHMRCDVCGSADQAMKFLEDAAKNNDPYHFALIDYRISGTNGLQLAEWIKSSAIPLDATLFMITALGQIVTSGKLQEKGFSGFFIKPFYPDQLKAALQVLWDAKQKGESLPLVTRHMITRMMHAGTSKEIIRPDMFPGTKVLVVEDMKVNMMLITKILEKHGCEVFPAVNGKEAVEKMRTGHYNIVFMDCQMPEMDGFEATRKIREEETDHRHHTTIVALTADAMTGDREKCLQSGMDDYLNKPLKPEQITEMLRKWLHDKAD